MKKIMKKVTKMVIGTAFFINTLFIQAESTDIFNEAIEYETHYYQIFDYDVDWEMAKLMCETAGGHLVAITSQEEQDTIESILKNANRNNYWMGGYRDQDNNWTWLTNETFEYANWAEYEPNNCDGIESKLMIYNKSNPVTNSRFASWNDLCEDGTCRGEEFFGVENIGFICEWEKAVVVKGSSLKNKDVIVRLGKDNKLSKTKITIKKGNKARIQKGNNISGKITFQSLNKTIASVSVKGVVKAKKKGKTAILIKNGRKTVKLKITVKR